MKQVFLTLFLLLNINLFSQNDTIVKNYVSIDVAKFTKLFNSQSQFYEVMYSRLIKKDNIIRVGLGYNQVSGSEKKLDFTLNLGYARVFKKYHRWRFYAGIDAINTFSDYHSAKKEQYQHGASMFLGIKYFLNNHFSISTEPALIGIYNLSIDSGDAAITGITKRAEWNDYGLRNLGQIMVSFHF